MADDVRISETPDPANAVGMRAHRILLSLVGLVALVWLLSGLYQVRADQVAIVERLGQYVATPDGVPIQISYGLHYHLPWPIDRVQLISTQQTQTLTVAAFNSSPLQYDEIKQAIIRDYQKNNIPANPDLLSALFDPYLITADKSVVHMEVSVSYRVNDPTAWVTTISHESDQGSTAGDDMRENLFQQLAQRAMIDQVGINTFEQLLFEKRAELPQIMLDTLKHGLNVNDPSDPKKSINLGIDVQKVDVTELKPPDLVKSWFQAVTNARSNKVTNVISANSAYDTALTKAKGETETLLLNAEVYRKNTVEASRGDLNRFAQILEQFNNAPDFTRFNLWMDAVSSVASNAVRIYYAQEGQRTVIILDPPKYDEAKTRPPNS